MAYSKLFLAIGDDPKTTLAFVAFILFTLLWLEQLITLFKSDVNQQAQEVMLIPVNKQHIVNSHSAVFSTPLFGVYQPKLSEAEIKQSTLDLEIVGIMYSPNPNKSQVILRSGGGDEQMHKLDDKILGGAVIKKINKDGIVVLYRGTLESLSLPKINLLFEETAKPLIKE